MASRKSRGKLARAAIQRPQPPAEPGQRHHRDGGRQQHQELGTDELQRAEQVAPAAPARRACGSPRSPSEGSPWTMAQTRCGLNSSTATRIIRYGPGRRHARRAAGCATKNRNIVAASTAALYLHSMASPSIAPAASHQRTRHPVAHCRSVHAGSAVKRQDAVHLECPIQKQNRHRPEGEHGDVVVVFDRAQGVPIGASPSGTPRGRPATGARCRVPAAKPPRDRPRCPVARRDRRPRSVRRKRPPPPRRSRPARADACGSPTATGGPSSASRPCPRERPAAPPAEPTSTRPGADRPTTRRRGPRPATAGQGSANTGPSRSAPSQASAAW